MTFKCVRCHTDVAYESDYPTCPKCGLVYSMVEPGIEVIVGEHTPPWATLDKQPDHIRKEFKLT